MDETERMVIDAFQRAVARGERVAACYLAAIAAWRARHPEHAASYAAQSATRVVLAVRTRGMIHAMVRDRDERVAVTKASGHRHRPAAFAWLAAEDTGDPPVIDDDD